MRAPVLDTAALMSVSPSVIEAMCHSAADTSGARLLADGVGASDGVASGRCYFSAEAALDAADRGESVVLVRPHTEVRDESAMRFSAAVVTARGGFASHAAVIARGWGVPAVCGVQGLVVGEAEARFGDQVIGEGARITVDGTEGRIFLGEVEADAGAGAVAELDPAVQAVLATAQKVIGDRVTIMANADSVEDVKRAVAFGAAGVGLCRTEQLFTGESLSALRDLILTGDGKKRLQLSGLIGRLQRDAFAELFEVLDGRPIVVRLLDAPLHEFFGESGGGDERLVETNPMLGLRGVRLGVVRPEIYRAQLDAMLDAHAEVVGSAAQHQLRILVPMVAHKGELLAAVAMVREAVAERRDRGVELAEPLIGTMVETPRSALIAGDLARIADFLSFGTNDLTQMCLGISRDDVDDRMGPAYVDGKLWADDPFRVLDRDGVARLIAMAVDAAVAAKPEVGIWACGEHAGEPRSIERLIAAGVRGLSCSPYRLPSTTVAAAQALLRHSAG